MWNPSLTPQSGHASNGKDLSLNKTAGYPSRSSVATSVMASYEFRDYMSPTYVGLLAEARIFLKLQNNLSIIRCPESSHVDGVLVVGETSRLPIDATERALLMASPDALQRFGRVIPFEVKHMSIYQNIRGCYWGWSSSKEQARIAEFYVILFGDRPDLAAIVPKIYAFSPPRKQAQSHQQRVGKTHWHPEHPSMVQHIAIGQDPLIRGIHPSFMPFITRIDRFSEAFLEMGACVNQGRPFVNKYWGITLQHWIPQPTRIDNVISGQIRNSLVRLDYIKKQVEKLSMTFRFLTVQPFLGDFRLIQLRPGGTSDHIIEHKMGFWMRDPQGLLHHFAGRADGSEYRYFFHPMVKWDFFFTEGQGQWSEMAFCIPRDAIPTSWWVTPANQGMKELVIDLKISRLDRFSIDYRQANWATTLWNILSNNHSTGSPPTAGQNFYKGYYNDESAKQFAGNQGKAGTSKTEQNQGTFASQQLMAAHTHLNNLCAVYGKGIFLSQAIWHPYGNWFFTYSRWAESSEVPNFQNLGQMPLQMADLDPLTVGIWITMLPLKRSGTLSNPNPTAHEMWRIYRPRPHLTIFRDQSEALNKGHSNFYLVPSEALQAKPEWAGLGPRQRPAGVSNGAEFKVPLIGSHSLIPFYRIGGDELVPTLLDILDNKGPSRVCWGQFELQDNAAYRCTISEAQSAMAEEWYNRG